MKKLRHYIAGTMLTLFSVGSFAQNCLTCDSNGTNKPSAGQDSENSRVFIRFQVNFTTKYDAEGYQYANSSAVLNSLTIMQVAPGTNKFTGTPKRLDEIGIPLNIPKIELQTDAEKTKIFFNGQERFCAENRQCITRRILETTKIISKVGVILKDTDTLSEKNGVIDQRLLKDALLRVLRRPVISFEYFPVEMPYFSCKLDSESEDREEQNCSITQGYVVNLGPEGSSTAQGNK